MSGKISFEKQWQAVFAIAGAERYDKETTAELYEAAETLRALSEGKFVSDGQFRVPEPVWEDIREPCPRCGVRFEFIVGGLNSSLVVTKP
jgi:hypothetical protein